MHLFLCCAFLRMLWTREIGQYHFAISNAQTPDPVTARFIEGNDLAYAGGLFCQRR